MSRVLSPDILCHLGCSNPYISKKAVLALIRIFKRVPELADDNADNIIALMMDRSHGVLVTAVQLMAEVILAEINSSRLIRSNIGVFSPTQSEL